MRRAAAVILGLILLLNLAGCGEAPVVNSHDNEAPASSLEGYYSSAQTYFGGEEKSNINLKAVDVQQQDDEMLITVQFTQLGGYGQEDQPTAELPYYYVSGVGNPARLVIHVEGIEYRGYSTQSAWMQIPQLVGMFEFIPNDTRLSDLYFHMQGDFVFKVEEKRDRIIVHVQKSDQIQQNAFFVTLNAYQYSMSNELTNRLDMKPTLCDDLHNIVLISKPYATKLEAEVRLAEIEQILLESGVPKLPAITQIEAGALPAYDDTSETKEIESMKILYKDGQEYSLPVACVGGRILCWTPEGNMGLYAQPMLQMDQETGEAITQDYLFLISQSGRQERLVEYPFSTILRAAFSPDGKKLALLEYLSDMRIVYIYDLETKELANVSEEGFGIVTWDFAWDDDSLKLYGMAGGTGETSINYQLLCYDLGKSPASRITALEEMPGAEGVIGYDGQNVYFSDITQGEQGRIFRVELLTGRRTEFTQGAYFTISPDRQWMAVTDAMSDDGGSNAALRLINLATGEAIVIQENELFNGIAFSAEGKTLYYVSDSPDNPDPNVNFYFGALTGYELATGVKTDLGEVAAVSFMPSYKEGEVLLVTMFMRQGEYIPITYLYEIGD